MSRAVISFAVVASVLGAGCTFAVTEIATAQANRQAGRTQLLADAKAAARAGDCVTVVKLGSHAKDADAEFHESVFLHDAAIASCIATAHGRWFWCTESKRSPGRGTCKPDIDSCEGFRGARLDPHHDLTPCDALAVAQCFDTGHQPHCAPSSQICEAVRSSAIDAGATASPCSPRPRAAVATSH